MPNLGELIFNLPENLKNEVRKFEKCMLKCTKIKLSCVYNDVCIRENILPKYTDINLHDRAAIQDEFTNEFRKKNSFLGS